MGFWGSIGDRVRGMMRFDKEAVVLNLAKGGTAAGAPQTGFDLLQSYGQDVLSDHLKLEHDLMARYVDNEEMDEYPELSSAIDIFADDATQTDALMNRSVWVDSSDKTVKMILEDLFHKRLRIDEEIWEMTRTVVKYGNSFEELLVTGDGLVGLNFLPPPTMRRVEGRRGELFGFVQDYKGRFNYSPEEFRQLLAQRSTNAENPQNRYSALEDWEVAHFRLRSKNRRSMYGVSPLDSARWIWKRLLLLEDAAMVYRLQRAPQRFAFYIDVGDMPPKEAMGFLHKMRQQYKKTKFYNPQCLTAETMVSLVDGTQRSMLELVRNYSDKEFSVFSYDLENGKVVEGKASKPRLTHEQAPIWLVKFDNGTDIRCTGNHPFLMRDGSYKAANMLASGDSLMPFYADRLEVIEPKAAAGLIELIASEVTRDALVVEEELVERIAKIEEFTWFSAGVLHGMLGENGFDSLREFKIYHSDKARWNNKSYGNYAIDDGHPNNHKVVSIEFAGYEDVYNMDIDNYHNFALSSGVFVHNTGKLDLKYNPLPVSFDTPIPLLDGRTVTIQKMAEEHAEGKRHWVYSVDKDTGKPVPGEVSWVGKTRDSAPTLRVTFDDGGHADMAPDHPVMRRDGSYVNAEKLRVGDSVMPLYRKVSSKKRGDALEGYDLWYDVSDQKSKYTHRIIAESLGIKKPGDLIHHVDFNKLNNAPENLHGMTYDAHRKLHKEAGHTGGATVSRMRKLDKDLDKRIRDGASRALTAYNKSAEKRAKTSILNHVNDTAQHIRNYNASEQHGADNEIRRAGKTAMWKDPERRARAQENMHLKFPDEFIDGIRALVRSNPTIRAEGVVRAVNDGLVSLLDAANTRDIPQVHRHLMLKLYRKLGHDDFNGFKQSCLHPTNHKVVSIEVIDPRDQYCMTVEKWHNFALLLRDENGQEIRNSGVFVKNSNDEDFFVPVRKGVQATKIDVVGSPSWQHMEDITYFKDKLFAAIKVPKTYLGTDAQMAKGALSQADVRFARTVLRIQREMRNGLKKMARVHLAALGINPAQVDFEIYMTVPSSIFELAQLEVRNAKADFAGRMSQFVSMHWILQKVFGLSEEEIDYIIKERHQEQLADAEIQAKSMGLTMDVQGKIQLQQQQAQAQLQQATAPPAQPGQPAQAAPAPNTQKAEELRKQLRDSGGLSHTWPQARHNLGYRPISEQELFHGNREHEKLVADNLNKILESNSGFARRMAELGHLINEIKLSMPGR